MNSGWTIEECGCFQDDWGRPVGWAVVDADGETIEFFRNEEDAIEWLLTKFGIRAGGA